MVSLPRLYFPLTISPFTSTFFSIVAFFSPTIMAASASALSTTGFPAFGDVVLISLDQGRGDVAVVVDKRRKRKTNLFKIYMMAVRDKIAVCDIRRGRGKSLDAFFFSEGVQLGSDIKEDEMTIFAKEYKILGRGDDFDLETFPWVDPVDIHVLSNKAVEVLEVSEDDDAGDEENPEAEIPTGKEPKPKGKAKV